MRRVAGKPPGGCRDGGETGKEVHRNVETSEETARAGDSKGMLLQPAFLASSPPQLPCSHFYKTFHAWMCTLLGVHMRTSLVSSFQRVIPGPVASAVPGHWLKMHILRSHPRSTESETWVEVEPSTPISL